MNPLSTELFGIDAIASDTSMRESLDGIGIRHLNEAFADIFYELQRGNVLQHIEHDPDSGDISKRFSWVTDIDLDRSLRLKFSRGGRSRWRIEPYKSPRASWDKLRSHVSHFAFKSFGQLWRATLTGSAMGI